jgi:hypothetical protein
MDGWDVYSSDGHVVGRVVEERRDALVVETGRIFTHRHLVPRAFVTTDEENGCVKTSLSKELIADSPRLDGDEVDEDAVPRHYGLVGTEVAPPTQGYGAVNADDPARGAEEQAQRDGVEPPEQARARMREELGSEGSPQTSGPLIGGEGERR